ncbi:C-type lectin domain family 4 member F-like [Pseudorasbora parva]|uniref:C-type lectin domain family 4 member F-like n=1 Tax=Pseudorasbora parva TaxID=51549 RepID=UPI00351F6039
MEFDLYINEPTTDGIYENDDVTEDTIGKEITDSTQGKSSEFTESDCVRNRSSRAAAVCLGLLCVLLLTAVIVLCVHIHTLSTNYTEERDQILNKITNITEERDGLIMNKKNLTNELQIHAHNLSLLSVISYRQVTVNNNKKLISELILLKDGWTYFKSSFYYLSNEEKSWTESRRYCTARGADLIIINNQKEQDFVKNISNGTSVWIGLTDRDVEGRWKWVDGSSLNSSFWWSGEPNGGSLQNCVLTVDHDRRWPQFLGWNDDPCDRAYQWICEKNISQLILP